MKGYGHTYGQEREYPEVEAQRKFFAELMAIIHEDPEKEKIRLEKNALIVSENMRTETIYWSKYFGCAFGFIIVYTALFAYLG